MGQVAFDTLKFVKKLELAGVPAKQAEAFSEAVRESHEAVDVATKRDLEDVRKDLSAEIANVRKDLSADIANVRKEMDARFDKVDARFDKINDKFEKLGMQMTIRLGLMVAAAVSIIAAILKM
ncbi:hypothetical protein SOPEG_0608 [Candidatus Sodalis pierantonius str. SOPE]|uniref:Uncharacterized protein n=1 Tax=Candidatus Sodalis pierantonii str. SOPE TaxID=2342 RepID=W0HHD0_9GAMM|nr:hypothetical protein [Candidatus Sodalis pierantonius]AHF73156.1 hypothetical protein SOPEG_0608 [Candidatus Sodalis pierantonius str. SOPE]